LIKVKQMISSNDYFKQRRPATILAMVVLVLGTALYFGTGVYKNVNINMLQVSIIDSNTLDLLRNVQLKAAYTDEGNIDIFALARNNDLAKQGTIQGDSIPEVGGMVLGNIEGSMMKKEGEFRNIGDTVEDYDIQFNINGVLDKTGSFADDFHFINVEQYNSLRGENDKLFIKFKDEKTPKLFYLYDKNNPSPAKIVLSEGNMNLYYQHIVGKKLYYPLILGYDEAKMMREEKLFANTGDTIDDFFGKNVMIVGVIQKTDTNMDMMHVVEPDFFEEQAIGVLV
jgi:hypothetical protein